MADANTATTLCWHCSEPYPIGDESCPACNATNGNVNPEQAQAEAKGAGKPLTLGKLAAMALDQVSQEQS